MLIDEFPVVDTVAVVASAVGGSAASFPHRNSTGLAPVPGLVIVIAVPCVSAWTCDTQTVPPAPAAVAAAAIVALASAQVEPLSASFPSVDRR